MDNTALVVFSNEEFGKVRTVGTPDDPKFCLADVCRSLEFIPSKVAQRLEDDVLSRYPITDSAGRTQIANFVNEDGLYDVILDSRKPAAKKFRKWITSEVLPSIRKTGAYSVQIPVQIPAQDQLFKFMDKLGSVNDPSAQLALIDMFRATIQNTQPNLASPDTITMEDLFYSYVVPTAVIKQIPKGNGRDGYSITALYQYVYQNFRDAVVRPSNGPSGIHRRECLVKQDRAEDIIKSLIEYNTSDLNAQL